MNESHNCEKQVILYGVYSLFVLFYDMIILCELKIKF